MRPSRVRLISAAIEERERGVVHVLKEGGFGFLRCETKVEQLFFHTSGIIGGQGKGKGGGNNDVRAGDEFDFVVGVDERTGKPNATKLKPLPRGTVKFETPVQEGITGMISTCTLASGSGEILLDEPYEGQAALTFSKFSVITPKQAMPVAGSKVTCTIAKHKARGHLLAIDINASARAGVVERLSTLRRRYHPLGGASCAAGRLRARRARSRSISRPGGCSGSAVGRRGGGSLFRGSGSFGGRRCRTVGGGGRGWSEHRWQRILLDRGAKGQRERFRRPRPLRLQKGAEA